MPDEDRVRLARFAPAGRSAEGMDLGMLFSAVLDCSRPTMPHLATNAKPINFLWMSGGLT